MNAQNRKTPKDSITLVDKVEVKGSKKKMETDMKMSVSVDEFLASSDKISFIKRGAYAWEPLLNNMSTERSVVTIDGMRIFGACTDKMDPVTSYLESNTLSSIDIKSGQEGSSHGATIAGSIDLKRKSTPFSLEKNGMALIRQVLNSTINSFSILEIFPIPGRNSLWMEVFPFGRQEIMMTEITKRSIIHNIINSIPELE